MDAAAWNDLRAALHGKYETLLGALRRQEDWSDPQRLTGVMALGPHAAYHLGTVRQMVARLGDV